MDREGMNIVKYFTKALTTISNDVNVQRTVGEDGIFIFVEILDFCGLFCITA